MGDSFRNQYWFVRHSSFFYTFFLYYLTVPYPMELVSKTLEPFTLFLHICKDLFVYFILFPLFIT